MDNSIVTRALNATVRPLLREAGYTEFVGRNAWRYGTFTIDHVTFLSMNAYIADGVGCTTFSFTGHAGVLFRALQPDIPRPREPELTFRSTLGKTLRQRMFHPWGRTKPTDRPDVLARASRREQSGRRGRGRCSCAAHSGLAVDREIARCP